MMTDSVADVITRIRNGQMAERTEVRSPYSKLRESVVDVLKREGYIRGWDKKPSTDGHEDLVIELKYFEGKPVIKEIKKVSKPGRRVYSKIKDLPKVYNGLGISVLSTPKGVLSDQEARQENVGGEVLCTVF
ncbi:30S ribosomal protein S8 [Alphaproteobacteria bacterium]|nr:30S ribosomal protein S8 [Alphaproteobacteria bacterium]